MLLLKRLHVREKETLPLKLQKEVQLQGEESVAPVVRRKAALREKHLREKAALKSEKDKQSLTLIAPFLFF